MELFSPISPTSIEACSKLPSCTCGTVIENFPPFVRSVAMSDGYTAHLSALPAGTVALNVAVFPSSFMSASERASVVKSEPSSQISFSMSPTAQLTLPVVSSRMVLVEISAVPSFSCAAAPVSVITGCAAVSVIVVYSGVLSSGSVGVSEISFAQETIASADASIRLRFDRRNSLVMVFIVIFSFSLITIQMYLHPPLNCVTVVGHAIVLFVAGCEAGFWGDCQGCQYRRLV